MKKFLSILCAVILTLSTAVLLTSCGTDDANEQNNGGVSEKDLIDDNSDRTTNDDNLIDDAEDTIDKATQDTKNTIDKITDEMKENGTVGNNSDTSNKTEAESIK